MKKLKNPGSIYLLTRKIYFLPVFILLLFSACTNEKPATTDVIVAFKNITTIDALNGTQSNQNVIVNGKKIIEAGPSSQVQIPQNATIIDGIGKYMIPGLWDAHVHLTSEDAMMPELFPLLVSYGILYVRDTGATLKEMLPLREEADRIHEASGMAPRIFTTGPHIDGPRLSWNSSVSAGTVEQARKRIKELEDARVDEIKVYDLIPYHVAMEVFSAAKSKNYPLAAHVPLSMDVVEASEAGITSMEHMYNLDVACSADWDSLLTARRKMIEEDKDLPGNTLRQSIYRAQRLHAFKTQDDERTDMVLNVLAKNNTWQVPTLVIIAQDEHRMYTRNDWKQSFRYLPATVRNRWMADSESKASESPSEEGLAHAAWAYNMVARLNNKQIGIMAGTDMPLSFLTPGYSLHEELALLVKAGLTPIQALEAATLRPAQYYGIENQQGAINKDMNADVLILNENPLDDIRNTTNIYAVMSNGFLITKEQMEETLTQLEKAMEMK